MVRQGDMELEDVVYKVIYIGYIREGKCYLLGKNGLIKVNRFVYDIYVCINNDRNISDILSIIRSKYKNQNINEEIIKRGVGVLIDQGIATINWRSIEAEYMEQEKKRDV